MKNFLYKKDSISDNEKKSVIKEQLPLFTEKKNRFQSKSYYEKLIELLQSDLDFHNRGSDYFSHNLHSFPAKFPPQLPKLFIEELTEPGEIVLDPMVGSGTTIVESI